MQMWRWRSVSKALLLGGGLKVLITEVGLWLYNLVLGWFERSAAIARKTQLFHSSDASA
ncbi:hypothetical protein [Nostoc sp.]|uniref:hypothetical protein n=1 Tax=Nostoc sp. TaxID=1180 RepID=UPI002FF46DBC